MKKLLCLLIAALLLTLCVPATIAEGDASAAVPVEVVPLEEGSVTVREVGETASAAPVATPEPEVVDEPEAADAPEAADEADAAPEADAADELEAADEPEASDEPEAPEEPQPTLRPISAPSRTPAPGNVMLGFEDGFALELPEGWRCHPVAEDMAAKGVVYCLSDAAGTGWLYVQSWNTDCTSISEIKALIDRAADIQTSGVYNFNGSDFVIYDLTEGDVSCCAALLDGRVLNLVFTPQSDEDFMVVAAQILNTFEIL